MNDCGLVVQDFSLIVKGIYVALVTIIGREIFAWLREHRGVKRQEASTIHNELPLNYLGEEINKNRQGIEERGGTNAKLYEDDENFYNLGKSLQQAGVKCLLSTTSLEHILLLTAPQIVRDWVLIRKHINYIRGVGELNKKLNTEEIPFQRRHAEWLSLVAFMWLKQQKYVLPEKYNYSIEEFELLYDNNPIAILDNENKLFFADPGVVYKNTKKLRNKIRNGYMKSMYPISKCLRIRFLP